MSGATSQNYDDRGFARPVPVRRPLQSNGRVPTVVWKHIGSRIGSRTKLLYCSACGQKRRACHCGETL